MNFSNEITKVTIKKPVLEFLAFADNHYVLLRLFVALPQTIQNEWVKHLKEGLRPSFVGYTYHPENCTVTVQFSSEIKYIFEMFYIGELYSPYLINYKEHSYKEILGMWYLPENLPEICNTLIEVTLEEYCKNHYGVQCVYNALNEHEQKEFIKLCESGFVPTTRNTTEPYFKLLFQNTARVFSMFGEFRLSSYRDTAIRF